MYVGDYLARRCVYTPDKVAVIDADDETLRRYSYAEMNARASALAAWLQQRDIGKGDRVGMLAREGIHFYDAFFACGKIGAVLAPYNWRLHPAEIAGQIRLTGPKVVLHAEDETAGELAKALSARSGLPPFQPLSALAGSDAHGAAPALCEDLREHDTACLLFTGGTTGKPKAAQVSHGHVVWNTFSAQLADVLGSDIFLNIFPMFHAGGLFAFSVPMLILGGTVVQTSRFDAAQTLRLIERERVTTFAAVPTVFQMLVETPQWCAADLSSLRYCLCGGAPMPVPLMEKYHKEKGVIFRQGFGMTEFGPDAFSLASEDATRKAGSIGKPNFFVDAKIADVESGEAVPATRIGELLLRGPAATTGYFGDPEATRAAFDSDHYFHTGDLAYVDEEGYYFIVDRLKDMFISGGENIYPAEIEAALYEHPDVSQAAVVGIPDEKWGQVGCAFVVPREKTAVGAEALLSFLRERLATYKIPKKIILRQDLPVSGAGKVLKSELRKLATSNG